MAEIVLITGCATGIGRALALELHGRKDKNGDALFRVWATDFRLKGVEDLQEIGIQIAQLDVTDTSSISAAVSHILATDGRIDIVVCNAGLAAAGWLAEMDYGDVERLFNVNVHGVFRTIQAVAPHMMSRQSGKIAIMGSVRAYYASAFNGPYSGAKAAISLMAESLRLELDPFNITVSTVCPAWVKSDILANSQENYDRYERPESFYHAAMPTVKVLRKSGYKHGITTQETAFDIANGLSKKKPARYIYTGGMVAQSLFWGFVQTWFRPAWLAASLQKQMTLDTAPQHAPKIWSGAYVKPEMNGKADSHQPIPITNQA